MAVGVYDNCYTRWNGCPSDPGDKGSSLSSGRANADLPALIRVTSGTADVNVAIASGEVNTRI